MDYYPEVDQFITILRDPFEMALSNYFYGKKLKGNRFRDGRSILMAKEFEDLNNYLLKRKSFLTNFMPDEINLNNYKDILEKHFVYLGIAEDLQASVNVLARKLGFSSVKIRKLNVSERNEEVLEESRQSYMEIHRLEYAVYDFALQTYKG